jgi:hypothetical protein
LTNRWLWAIVSVTPVAAWRGLFGQLCRSARQSPDCTGLSVQTR